MSQMNLELGQKKSCYDVQNNLIADLVVYKNSCDIVMIEEIKVEVENTVDID